MILQALLSIAIVTVLAGAILTSALVNAKVAAHQSATRLATAALSRGTDEFVNWAQRYVAKHGSATTWPTTPIIDQPVAGCNIQLSMSADQTNCNISVTTSFNVVASSVSSRFGNDPENNLQLALNENRISGIVTSEVTNNQGLLLNETSSFNTLRIFNSPPYAVLTGSQNISSIAGSQNAHEGDTAGYSQENRVLVQATPNPANPTFDQDTAIHVTMSCSNSPENSSEGSPMNDNSSPGNDMLPWGAVGGGAFEAPCSPSYTFSAAPALPNNATVPPGNVYDIGNFANASWTAFKPTSQR